MSLVQKNTKKQGDVGLGSCIAYFTRIGWSVCIPLTDNQPYDLIVDDESKIYRVQIKTTRYKKDDKNFFVSLTIKGGNQTFSTIKKFDNSMVELLYILTGDGDEYIIPTSEVKQSITLSERWDQYKV